MKVTDLTGDKEKERKLQNIADKMVEGAAKYPDGVLVDIHNRTIEDLLLVCEEYEGAMLKVTTYSLKDFLVKVKDALPKM